MAATVRSLNYGRCKQKVIRQNQLHCIHQGKIESTLAGSIIFSWKSFTCDLACHPSSLFRLHLEHCDLKLPLYYRKHTAETKAKTSDAAETKEAVDDQIMFNDKSSPFSCSRCEDGCGNLAQQGGVYVKHGGRVKRCSQDKCGNQVVQGGVCLRHGARVKRRS
jgi:hypothetical protein